jgi:phosphate transport system substrate-binding protein
MKPFKILPALILVVLTFQVAFTQVANKANISISGTRFTYPLIEKWISEYNLSHPGVQISIAPKTADPKLADLKIIAHAPGVNELEKDQKLFLINKYALLPVTGKTNPLASNNKKTLSKKDLDKLFFEESILDDNTSKNKAFSNLNIYSREGQACASIAFAEYFGHKPAELKGKKISGDDIFLLTAIQKDSLGVTFNNLGYIFDLKSRKIKNGIAVLPVDLKKEAVEDINLNLDQAIQVLESSSFETIPVANVGFVFKTNEASQNIKDFLKWVATDGQKFNHEYGFLNLDKETLSNQIGIIDNNYLSSAN